MQAVVATYIGRKVTEELNKGEIAEARELIDLACFSALSRRNLFADLDHYCNRDTFTLYVQRFEIPIDMIAIETARGRGAGRGLTGWTVERLHITIPPHVSPSGDVELDEGLLHALLCFRASEPLGTWHRWSNAISSYNLANTDSDNVSFATEWTLMCGAFELLLGAKSNQEDVAKKFTGALVPKTSIPASRSARRKDDFKPGANLPLRQEWMREFYRIRGSLAHGWKESHQAGAWTVAEHIALARLTFPLVVKSLLAGKALYSLKDEDTSWIYYLECLMNCDSLKHKRSITRAVGKIRSTLEYQRGRERLRRSLSQDISPEASLN